TIRPASNIVAGIAVELVRVGARREDHLRQPGIVRDTRRAVEAGLDPGRALFVYREVGVDIDAAIEEVADDALDASRSPRVAAKETREARIEDRLAAEGAALLVREGGIAREESDGIVVGATHARRVQIVTFERGIGDEQAGSRPHVALACGPNEPARPLTRVELPSLDELLPARPACEAILARDDELCIVQRGGLRRLG